MKNTVHSSSEALQAFKSVAAAGAADQVLLANPLVDEWCQRLESAAVKLEKEESVLDGVFSSLDQVKDAAGLHTELQKLIDCAEAAERSAADIQSQAASHYEKMNSQFSTMLMEQKKSIDMAVAVVSKEFSVATAALAELSSMTATALVADLKSRKEERRAEFAAQVTSRNELDVALYQQRLARQEAQEQSLADLRASEHASHDALWHQISRQTTDLAQQLSTAKIDQKVTADQLSYNCRVLEERTRENTSVATELRHTLSRQEAALAGLRARHAEEESSAKEEQQQLREQAVRAADALENLIKKEKHFKAADEAELRQLVAFKEEQMNKLLMKLDSAQKCVAELCGMDILGGSTTETHVESEDDDILEEQFWRAKFQGKLAIKEKLKELECAARADLQLGTSSSSSS